MTCTSGENLRDRDGLVHEPLLLKNDKWFPMCVALDAVEYQHPAEYSDKALVRCAITCVRCVVSEFKWSRG